MDEFLDDFARYEDNIDPIDEFIGQFSHFVEQEYPNIQYGGQQNFYTLVKTLTRSNKKFRCEETQYDLRLSITESLTFDELNTELRNMFLNIYNEFTSKMGDRDKIRMVFFHDQFEYPVSIQFMYKRSITVDHLINKFEKTTQSYRSVKLYNNQNFKVSVIIQRTPTGGHKHKNIKKQQTPKKTRVKSTPTKIPRNQYKKSHKNMEDFCNNTKGIKVVHNKDNFCLVRAILLGKAYADDEKNRYTFLRVNSRVLDNRTIKLVRDCQFENKPMGIPELKKIEVYLKDYTINLFQQEGVCKEKIYKGPANSKYINILLLKEHYNVITSMARFYNCGYYCDICEKKFTSLGNHRCPATCKLCKRLKCSEFDQSSISCSYCYKKCKNEACLRIHSERFCAKRQICDDCHHYRNNNHVCQDDERWCTNCKKSVNSAHRCFILREDEKKAFQKTLSSYIFFDYECYVGDRNEHVPNLVYAELICNSCIDFPNPSCAVCKKVHFFDNESFCEWLFQQKDSIAIAHNMKGYDGCFVLQYILEHILTIDSFPHILCTGTKLLSIEFRHVKLIDSYSFIATALENFPKTFGIKELRKGYFPHLFNKPENFTYIGAYPDISQYGIEYFTPKKKSEFLQWYDANKNSLFDFRKELLEYCISDVRLLKEGCLSFRKTIMNYTNANNNAIDPFLETLTIASLSHKCYRQNFMPSKSIAIIPEYGYNPKQRTSNKCIKWLRYYSEHNNVRIQHAKNGGEERCGQYLLDGISHEKQIIFEFHGCLFHGCPKCYSSSSWNRIKQQTMGTTYKRHLDRIEFIKQNLPEFELIEIWECEFDALDKQDPDFAAFIKKARVEVPLNPRDALYGGRTNAFKLHFNCNDRQKIKYYDFTSLYPYVEKYCEFPAGHPTIITENFQELHNYFGLVKCRILPPRGLYIPVLPTKCDAKLLFTLCQKCAEIQLDGNCLHSPQERMIEGTWVILEVLEAIKKGYIVQEIFEIWHWGRTKKYDPVFKKGGLFTDYVNAFLKGKQEASGYPDHVQTIEEKRLYVQNYFTKEGVMLDENNIEKNPVIRNTMKMMLNSHWGRFGMKANRVQHKIITTSMDWFKLIFNDEIEVQSIDLSHESYLQVFYTHNNDQYEGSNQVNVPLAAFVTAHARLKLLSELDKLGGRVLYFDTDSIIFYTEDHLYEPLLGDYLGEMTSEIENGEHIVEFISAGPKNYAYRLSNGETCCTVKGFTLNSSALESLNFESIKSTVCDNRTEKIPIKQLKFTRNKTDWSIHTSEILKSYAFVYTKRRIINQFDTLPFGY